MGLKVDGMGSVAVMAADKIRPKWDWKSIGWWSSLTPSISIKSDQNGIESQALDNEVGFVERIKSDQNGIESNFLFDKLERFIEG